MLYFDDIKVEFESQEFKGTHMEISPNKDKSVLFLESVRSMQTVRCPYCGGSDGQNGFRRRKKVRFPHWYGLQFKKKRLIGLAAHAIYSISTGKLEGFNNKIKVAKRIGYGYRDDDFFFTLIRYLSIPYVRSPSHKKS